MIGKLGLAAALAGALLLVQPGGAGAGPLSQAGTSAKPGAANAVTQVRYRRGWRNNRWHRHHGYRRHWRQGRYYNRGYYNRRFYRRRYYGYNPYYYGNSYNYGYRPYRYYRPYRRLYHRPRIGIYISF